MAVKRKSNWYIYLLALIISFVLLGLFVNSIWDRLFPDIEPGTRSAARSDYRPSKDVNLTSLLMLSDMKAETPKLYMLMNYQPRNEVILFIPLRENTKVSYGGYSGSLYEMYDNYGAEAVVSGLSDLLGAEIVHYIKFDRLSFTDFVNMGGEVYVNIPADVVKKETKNVKKTKIVEVNGVPTEVVRYTPETTETVVWTEGDKHFDGAALYEYLTYDFGWGEDYQLSVVGSAAMNMINKNFRGLSAAQVQGYAEAIIKNTETDIVLSDYTSVQPTIAYTIENSISPCVYYTTYGETEGGYFILSEDCIATMLERMAIKSKEETK